MSKVTRYTPEVNRIIGVAMAADANGRYVQFSDFDRVTAERDALQQRLTASDEELNQCQSMARMIEKKEWAEHVGKGPISSQVESSFTQLHNELSEARQGLTAADERADVLEGLLRRVVDSSVLSFEQDAPEELESLEADICAALNPAEGLDRRDMAGKMHLMKREAQVNTSCEWCAGCGHDPYGEKCEQCQP